MEEIFTEQILQKWIKSHEEEMIGDIRKLVEIPSIAEIGDEQNPYGNSCAKALEQMKIICDRLGFETKNHGNRCMVVYWGNGETKVGIWGHLDVVPAGREWVYPPFQCTQNKGFLIGRGVQDNKGPVIVFLYAMRFLKERGFAPVVGFQQILGCNEEQGMGDVDYYLKETQAPHVSFVVDCNFPVCCGEKGICKIQIKSSDVDKKLENLQGGTSANSVPSYAEASVEGEKKWAYGVGGHAAFPEGSQNAIGVLCRQLSQVLPKERSIRFLSALASDGYGKTIELACKDDISGPLTCNVGMVRMKGGKVEAEIDIRYPVTKNIEGILKKLEISMKKYGYEIMEIRDSPPYYVPSDSEIVRLLTETYKQRRVGDSTAPYVMGGGTYARKIPNAVGFGPGMGMDFSDLGLEEGHGNCHGADEAQSIENLEKALEIYIYSLVNIDRYFENKQK